MRTLPFLLLPAVALVAQAPAPGSLVQRFNSELPGINQLLKELKATDAMAKAESLVPKGKFAIQPDNLKTIAESVDNAQGLMSLYRLWANAATEAGQWEKALEIQEQRLKAAKDLTSDLDKAQAPIAAQWKKVEADAKAALEKMGPRKTELEVALKGLQDEIAAVNAKQKKLDAKGMEDLKARAAKGPQDQAELDQIVAAIPVHQQNIANAPKVAKLLADNRKEADAMVKAADEAVAKGKEALASQKGEITKFNMDQVMKKVKIAGNKNWVDAVMNNAENVTKLSGAQAQAAFLNRMLVLDPGNAKAQAALDNLKAGKELFPKPAKGAKGAKKAKK